jgi:hypothetical protein
MVRPSNSEPEVLLMKHCSTARVMPNAYVFTGTAVPPGVTGVPIAMRIARPCSL